MRDTSSAKCGHTSHIREEGQKCCSMYSEPGTCEVAKCTYTHIHTHVHMNIHIHAQAHVHTHIHTCIHTHKHMHTHTCMHACTCTHIHVHMTAVSSNCVTLAPCLHMQVIGGIKYLGLHPSVNTQCRTVLWVQGRRKQN